MTFHSGQDEPSIGSHSQQRDLSPQTSHKLSFFPLQASERTLPAWLLSYHLQPGFHYGVDQRVDRFTGLPSNPKNPPLNIPIGGKSLLDWSNYLGLAPGSLGNPTKLCV